MKAGSICLLLLPMLLLMPCEAATQEEIMERQSESLGLEELEERGSAYLGDLEVEDANLEEGLSVILKKGSGELEGVVRKALGSGMVLLSIVLLLGVAGELLSEKKSWGLPVVSMAGALAVTAVAVIDVESMLGLGRSTLANLTDFSNLLFPVVTALAAATGAITGAAAKQVAVMLFSEVLMNLMDRLLLPMVYAYLAASVAHAALGNDGLKRVAAFLKWTVTMILTILLMSFVAYLTMSGVVAGHADAAAVKAAKFALSSAIPVVGGILSDAADTVLAGASVLRGTVGVYGMLAVLAMCIVPFLQLGVHYLAYKLTAAMAATVADGRTASLIDSIGSAFGLIFGMTGAQTLMVLITLISALTVMNV